MPRRLLRIANKQWFKVVVVLLLVPPTLVWTTLLYDEYLGVPTLYDRDFMEGLYQTCLDRGHNPNTCRREAMRMADLKNFRPHIPQPPR